MNKINYLSLTGYLSKFITLFFSFELFYAFSFTYFFTNPIDVSVQNQSIIRFGDFGWVHINQGVFLLSEGLPIHLLSSKEIAIFHWIGFLGFCLLFLSLVWAFIGFFILSGKLRFKLLYVVCIAVIVSFSPLSRIPEVQTDSLILYLTLLISMIGMEVLISSHIKLEHIASEKSLLLFASQSGSAKKIAQKIHKGFEGKADLSCISHIRAGNLRSYETVIFVVSTYGKGEAPDTAKRFMESLKEYTFAAKSVRFSVLALGDKHQYPKTFCAFGHVLNDLMVLKGFQQLCPVEEVDRSNPEIVRSWLMNLNSILGSHAQYYDDKYHTLTVSGNERLNPNSFARKIHRITLTGLTAAYRAGDVVCIKPVISDKNIRQRLIILGWPLDTEVSLDNQKMPFWQAMKNLDWLGETASSPQKLVDSLCSLSDRKYSIASSRSGELELLVRQHIRPDGVLGLCSEYICSLEEGDNIELSILPQEHFRLPDDQDLPIIMLGAGAGLAPLISFLEEKHRQGSLQYHWLFFGEQYSDSDAYLAEDIAYYQKIGLLDRVDFAWSKTCGLYLQDVVAKNKKGIVNLVKNENAHIYVCGNLAGLGLPVKSLFDNWFDDEILEHYVHYDLY